jgi:hypothetical protein
MSDTRTDREIIASATNEQAAIAHRLDSAVGGVLFNVSNFPERAQSRLLGQDIAPLRGKIVTAILGVLGDIRIPRASTIAVPHTPEEIHAAADVWCDLDFWDRADLEYTEYGIEHIPSGATISPDHAHLPDELRPDIGEDRVDI